MLFFYYYGMEENIMKFLNVRNDQDRKNAEESLAKLFNGERVVNDSFIKYFTLTGLKSIAKSRGEKVSGKKEELWQRLNDVQDLNEDESDSDVGDYDSDDLSSDDSDGDDALGKVKSHRYNYKINADATDDQALIAAFKQKYG